MKPLQLVNYPGNKARMLHRILAKLDTTKKVFIEPFLGSGNVYLNVPPTFKAYLVSDIVPYVPYLYEILTGTDEDFQKVLAYAEELCRTVKVKPEDDVLRRLRRSEPVDLSLYQPNKDVYYSFRDAWNKKRGQMSMEVIVEFLFLANSCINNLVRFGREGEFNQGWGGRCLDVKRLAQAREQLAPKRGASWFFTSDFTHLLKEAESLLPEACVYLDPPYGGRTEASVNGLYNLSSEWTKEHDILVAIHCDMIHEAGGKFVLSNLKENERLIEQLQRYRIEELKDVSYKCSPGKHGRRQQTEVLVSN